MYAGTLIFVLAAVFSMINPRAEQATGPEVEEHIRDLLKELPSGSWLRGALLEGARGKGLRFPWMDEMRKDGIKRVEVWVDIQFDRAGKPKKLTVGRTLYFTQYYDRAPLSDDNELKAIRATGLENELDKLALQQALHGSWFEHPRSDSNPIVGGANVIFFDDEWLPSLPLLYTFVPPNGAD